MRVQARYPSVPYQLKTSHMYNIICIPLSSLGPVAPRSEYYRVPPHALGHPLSVITRQGQVFMYPDPALNAWQSDKKL